jgi:Zn-dependent M16 (insulinase) family peptidase
MGLISIGQKLHGFEIIDIKDLGELKATGVFARHEVTGCEVYHVLNDDDENLFAYAFMTPPVDSTGVAHILEHSVLCGSKNYPIKDPFLVLAKQSVKTFLNAMTFPDKTVYPASSMVEADYFNLMSVYGDAVFFPLLEEWTFAQEGHRFGFAPDGSVSILGVVFNEMRGNYSSFDAIAGDWSLRSILSGTPYEHDSGGDPACIPDLTYEEFCAFHAKYYHPANCRIYLQGNIPTERQLALLEEKFLSKFGRAEKPSFAAPVQAFGKPVSMEVPAPADAEKDLSKATVMLNWLLPDSTDTVALMEANLVTEILLGHDGSPLSHALLDSGLGEDIAPSSGLETEIRHMCFSVGLRGVKKTRAAEFESLVLGTITGLIASGVSRDDVDTAVRSIDFSNREVRRSGGPFALTLMRRSLRGWIHGLGPDATLRYVPAFEEVKRRLAADPRYIEGLLEAWFIRNAHRSLVTVYPDPEYEKRLDDKLSERVRLFESTLTDGNRASLLAAQDELFARQQSPDDPSFLSRIPHISRTDLPVEIDRVETGISILGRVPLLAHEQPTNGVAYVDIAIPVDGLPVDDYPLLPFFSSVLTGMGLDGLSWTETSALAARWTGGLGTMLFSSSVVRGSSVPAPLDPSVAGRDLLIVRVKMLEELSSEALELAFRFLRSADFSDAKRLTDLLAEYRNDLDSSIAPGGNQYAVSRAGLRTGRSRAVDELWNGLAQVRYVRELSAKAKNDRFLADLSGRLAAIRDRLLSAGMILNVTGTSSIIADLRARLAPLVAGYDAPAPVTPAGIDAFEEYISFGGESPVSEAFSPDSSSIELVSASVQVGFAAAALPSLPYGTPDHPVYAVFGHWLSNGPLWEKIRTTGGAYGAFAYPDSLEDIFIFSTYRDPNPVVSLDAYREALESAAKAPIDEVSLERVVTGCYSREVQPRSPSDKGFTAFVRILYGISDEVRGEKIRRIVSVTPGDMQSCAQRLLDSWPSVRAAIVAGKKQLKDTGKANFAGNVIHFTV